MKNLVVFLTLCLMINFVEANAQQTSKRDNVADETVFVLGGYGFSGKPTDVYQELNEAVRAKDMNKLSVWLHSGRPAVQLYALEGYKRLGTVLDAFTRDAISSVLERKVEVATGGGCFVSYRPLQEVVKE